MLGPEEFEKLLSQLGEPHRTMLVVIVLTGLRIGEMLALRWGALDDVINHLKTYLSERLPE